MRIGSRRQRVQRGRRSASLLVRCGWLVCLATGWSGCAVQNRIRIPTAPAAAPLRETTLPELLQQVRRQQEAIQTITATVQVQPSVTSPQRGEIVTYRDVRAFLLIRKPADLRMIGQYPVVRNTAFDLASDGERFGLYIPSKNRYLVGDSRGGKRSKSPLENLRPQHLLDALLVAGPQPDREEAVWELAREGQNSYYIVLILRRREEGGLRLARKLWFEREQLTLARLQVFDEGGEVETDVRYSSYGNFSGIPYPQRIVLDRPLDDYGLELTVTDLKFNLPLEDAKFEMAPPAGAELVDIEKTAS
ncbi:MAG TPA: hypothetical protein VNN17_02915 [Terriglobia bacterium]|nr:hypothetical protein [Terriglobia bacterium]